MDSITINLHLQFTNYSKKKKKKDWQLNQPITVVEKTVRAVKPQVKMFE